MTTESQNEALNKSFRKLDKLNLILEDQRLLGATTVEILNTIKGINNRTELIKLQLINLQALENGFKL